MDKRRVGPWPRAILHITLSVGAAFLLVGCPHDKPTTPTTSTGRENTLNATDPRWVSRDPAAPQKVAVVFVHGIFGDTLGTWTSDNGQTFFDLLRTSPELRGKVDVYAFGFTSTMLGGGSLSIREAASKLDSSLTFDHVWDYPTVVFVAHSMGGLVVIRELYSNRNYLQQTPLIMLFGTPSAGAQIATIGDLFLQNPALGNMRPADGNEFLKLLDDDWTNTPHPQTRVVCAYETKATGPIVVVPWSSASRHCDEAARPIEDSSHLTIVKPDRPTHPSVVVLVNAINKYVFAAQRDAGIDTPNFSPSGSAWSYQVMDLNHANPAVLINRSPRQVHYDVINVSPGVWIDPKDSDIAAIGKAQLDIIIMRGELTNAYSFDLRVEPLPLWHVNVLLPPVQAVQTQQRELAASLSNDLSSYLNTGNTLAELNKQPNEKQLRAVVEIARKTVAREHPSLDPEVQWLVTGDALASLGWSNLAFTAMDEMNSTNPKFSQTDVAQSVGARIAALNGNPAKFDWVAPAHRRSEDDVKAQASMVWVDADSATEALRLSHSLQSVSSLKREGLILQGDVFKVKGDTTHAKEAYFEANKIRKSAVTDDRIKNLREFNFGKNT